jgi:hypothetical protein
MTNQEQEQIKLRLEERLRVDPIFRELYPKLLAIPLKPKLKTEVHIQLEGKIAEAAKANPDSVQVRIIARGVDGTIVIDSPRQAKVIEVEVKA